MFVLLICSNLFNKLLGHLHDDAFLLLKPEFISFFLSYLNLVVVCHLHGQTGGSMVWANSGLVNFLPISSITAKTANA